mmetsp:Transcript_24708/g.21878  ORF Transcript_24708/g.21878 Transcript_24708/m.21878 type:complete len:198 (-) Transcript_24708:484-1077(-)
MQFLSNLLSSSASIDIAFDGVETRKHVTIKDREGNPQKLPLYHANEELTGEVQISVGSNKLEHNGIKIELVGFIDAHYDKTQSSEFMAITRELEPAGILQVDKAYSFSFTKFEQPYESYSGIGMSLRYFVRVSVIKGGYTGNQTKEKDFAIQLPTPEPDFNRNIKMDVGIEDCLHIEFEYNKSSYHLKDCVIGKVYF